MESTFSSALSLLAVGMITVFVVLALVVIAGNVMIRVVNAMTPDEPIAAKTSQIEGDKLAAITAAIDLVTGGKGKITKVEKVN